MPEPRMTLRDRLIGGAVDGLMIAIDTIASFWQTPREVEWAKAAGECPELQWPAKGFAEVLAENPEVAKVLSDLVFDEDHRGYYSTPTCGLVHATFIGGQPGHRHACYRDPGHVGDAHHCLCGYEWENFATSAALVPETSAPTPGAVDGPAEGEPPEPSAGVGTVCVVCFRPSGNCDCFERLFGTGPARSAAVESPASVPAAESPAPEFDWVTTAIPVIAGVLAEHKFLPIMGRCECPSLPRVADWQRWSEHVSPIIAIAIQTDLLSTIYEDTTFAINAFSGDRPRPLADFPKHQNPRM